MAKSKPPFKGNISRLPTKAAIPSCWVASYYKKPINYLKPIYEFFDTEPEARTRFLAVNKDRQYVGAKLFIMSMKIRKIIEDYQAEKVRYSELTPDQIWMENFKKQVHDKSFRRADALAAMRGDH